MKERKFVVHKQAWYDTDQDSQTSGVIKLKKKHTRENEIGVRELRERECSSDGEKRKADRADATTWKKDVCGGGGREREKSQNNNNNIKGQIVPWSNLINLSR